MEKDNEVVLNAHNKAEYPPMHTAEHLLNQTMVRMFGCPRSRNAHIERKKSKADYELAAAPTEEQVREIEKRVNEQINRCLDVRVSYMKREETASLVDLSRLPADASETLRIVSIGDYDNCACAGTHVTNTGTIGKFVILTHDYENGRWRMRFRLENTTWNEESPIAK